MHSSTNDKAMPALSATRYAPAPRPSFSVRPELWALVPILAALNLHLVVPGVLPPLHFRADLVAAGEWWRLLTHPFVHVSGWHLFLDGAAFLLLQAGLREPSLLRRLAFAASSAAGALAAAVLLHEETAVLGYCGLSGAAHGLMAVSALELALGRAGAGLRRAGVILLAIVAVKSRPGPASACSTSSTWDGWECRWRYPTREASWADCSPTPLSRPALARRFRLSLRTVQVLEQ